MVGRRFHSLQAMRVEDDDENHPRGGQSLVEPIVAAGTTNVPGFAALTLQCTATGDVGSPRLRIYTVLQLSIRVYRGF